MKFITNKENYKKIVISILIIMTFNFITPTISRADFGGDLFKPVADLIYALADLVMEIMQGYFVGNESLTDTSPAFRNKVFY